MTISIDDFKQVIIEFIDKILEINMKELSQSAEQIRLKYPQLTDEQIVFKLIQKAKFTTGIIGGGTTFVAQLPAIAGPGGALVVAGANIGAAFYDFKKSTNVQCALVVKIASLYGYKLDENNPNHKSIVLEAIFGKELQTIARLSGKFLEEAIKKIIDKIFTESIAKQMYYDLLEKFGIVVAKRVTARNIRFFIPLIGPCVVGGINWYATKTVGENAHLFFSEARKQNIDLS